MIKTRNKWFIYIRILMMIVSILFCRYLICMINFAIGIKLRFVIRRTISIRVFFHLFQYLKSFFFKRTLHFLYIKLCLLHSLRFCHSQEIIDLFNLICRFTSISFISMFRFLQKLFLIKRIFTI